MGNHFLSLVCHTISFPYSFPGDGYLVESGDQLVLNCYYDSTGMWLYMYLTRYLTQHVFDTLSDSTRIWHIIWLNMHVTHYLTQHVNDSLFDSTCKWLIIWLNMYVTHFLTQHVRHSLSDSCMWFITCLIIWTNLYICKSDWACISPNNAFPRKVACPLHYTHENLKSYPRVVSVPCTV